MSIFVKLFSVYFFAYVIIIYYNGHPTWGFGELLTTPAAKKFLRHVTLGLGIGGLL
jgi:hypothetical protein